MLSNLLERKLKYFFKQVMIILWLLLRLKKDELEAQLNVLNSHFGAQTVGQEQLHKSKGWELPFCWLYERQPLFILGFLCRTSATQCCSHVILEIDSSIIFLWVVIGNLFGLQYLTQVLDMAAERNHAQHFELFFNGYSLLLSCGGAAWFGQKLQHSKFGWVLWLHTVVNDKMIKL